MGAGRPELPERLQIALHQLAAVTPPLRARDQIDVQVRGKTLVGLGAEVVGVMVGMVRLLHCRPSGRIAARLGELRDQRRPPFTFVAFVEASRVERAQRVAADPVLILEDQTQLRLECQIRPDVDAPERVGITRKTGGRVAAVIAGLETDAVGAGPIRESAAPDRAGTAAASAWQDRDNSSA